MRLAIGILFGLYVSMASAWALTGGERVSIEEFSNVPNPNQVITNYDVASIGGFLNELDFEWMQQSVEGNPMLVANVFGLMVFFVPSNCETENQTVCTDLQMISFFDQQGPSLQRLHDYSRENAFALVGIGREGGFFVRRYDWEVAGIPRRNFAATILAFRNYVETFLNALQLSVQNDSEFGPQGSNAAIGFAGDAAGSPISDSSSESAKSETFGHQDVDVDALLDAISARPEYINKVLKK